MTGKELMIYILENDLQGVEFEINSQSEKVSVTQDNLMSKIQIAEKFNVGLPTVETWLKLGILKPISVNGEDYVERPKDRIDRINESLKAQPFIFENLSAANQAMVNIVDLVSTYGAVTIADVKDICGLESSYTDNLIGWTSLDGIGVKPIREGFMITMPISAKKL